jgi:beta-mannosidase
MRQHGRDHLYVRAALDVGGACVSEKTVFLTHPRFLALPRGPVARRARQVSPTVVAVTFRSRVFQHAFTFDFGDRLFEADDNGFDLYPAEAKTVRVTCATPVRAAALLRELRHRSLADSA